MWHDPAIARIEFHVDVARPAHEVFAYLIDPAHLHDWDPRIVEVAHDPPGPLSTGTRIREVRSILGRRVAQARVVSEIEPPVLIAERIVEGPLPMEIRTVLEPQGANTRVHVSATGELNGIARVAERVLARGVKRQLRISYEQLRERLEAEG